MLVSLKIENFALIDQLDLELQPGLNVLTGETGAGKSIILDAIDAVLGGKASGRWVRTGTDKAHIEAAFNLDSRVSSWLKENEIPTKGDLFVCRRELTAGKNSVRSKSRLNGVVVKKPQMDELRRLLIEITAQGQTMQLGSPDIQRDWLDGFGDKTLVKQKQQVATDYETAAAAKKLLDTCRRAEQQRTDQLDMFEFQSKELTAAAIEDPNELESLQIEHHRLSHSVELQQQSYQTYQLLYENDEGEACTDMLGQAEATLSDMLRFDPEVEAILEMVGEAIAQVQEAGRQINAYGENIETDPERLEEIDQRIAQLQQLCRKYNRDLPALIEYYQGIQASLAALTGDGQSIEDLEADYKQKQTVLLKSCDQLTKLRQTAAEKLEKNLVAQLKPLAMERVKFKVGIQSQAPTIHGADLISFLFSPNPGEPLQPLLEIASGGEMSRFLLALKACFSSIDPIGTMVFDEIDVGVSGRVAQAIAEKLYQLGQSHQVLCVTHQPLVAAMADAHYHVGKHVVSAPLEISAKGRQPKRKTAASKSAVADITADSSNSSEEAKARAKIAAQVKQAADQQKGAEPEATADAEERTIVKVTPLDALERREELAQLAGGKSHSEAIAFADSLLLQAETIRKAG
ncbi:MAG: DNA repair protein RecN [Leptolyngbya foveolarum]|uniref:DNA repair protein RecN n=1 Tax=Leptolyngbya foveolarum TaxID=47253 RepID=A0A2W4U0H4_9CYAN|nr:MAG: DNA repair protein RecN [Leptolyngbya foveolarum]